jgi:hypothetical protein
MPEPVWGSNVMVGNMPETGENVKNTTNQRLWGGRGTPRPTQSRWLRVLETVLETGKRQTSPAVSGQPFA